MTLEEFSPQRTQRPRSEGGIVRTLCVLCGSWEFAVLGAALLTAAVLLPFVGRAFHVDDPLFLWVARQIQAHPFDPFGFDVNWYGGPMPMSRVTKNPPLTSYGIALVAGVFGWGEEALHLAFLLPAVGVVLGTYLIARKLCRRPVIAALAVLGSPAFVVSGTTVMSDVPMLCLWVFAIFFWLEGMERGSRGMLACAGLLAGASSLTKYFGVALVPLLLAHSLATDRGVRRRVLFLLIPVAILAAYGMATSARYGSGMLLDVASYAGRHGGIVRWAPAKLLVNLGFCGGCVVFLAFCGWWVCSRRVLYGAAGSVALCAGAVLVAGSIGSYPLPPETFSRGLLAIQFALFVACGLAVMALCVADAARQGDRYSLLLVLWVAGTFLFSGGVNWTTNARSVLPMVPAVAILVARAIDRREAAGGCTGGFGVAWSLAGAVVLSLLCARADESFANSYRSVAQTIAQRHGGGDRPVWFLGHWGFQYYMERSGARPIDATRPDIEPHDLIAIPATNTNVYPIDPSSLRLVEVIPVPLTPWIATMSPMVGAGFHADVYGPLPFAIGPVPPEVCYLVEVEDAESVRAQLLHWGSGLPRFPG